MKIHTFSRDRTVHATTGDKCEVVRYDRAGKWYVEPTDDRKRRRVTLEEAADIAANGTPFLDLPGGQRFDVLVRRICLDVGPDD